MMKKFVIAFIDFFDNELKMEKVEAQNEKEALINYFGWSNLKEMTVKEIKRVALDSDLAISILEI